jgi:low temperature requirement protein LtrA
MADQPASGGSAAAPGRVSTLELFFDLVFVFTITQLALIVERSPGWPAVGQAVLELLVIYWMYSGFAWLTNTLGSAASRQQSVLLLGMAAFFIVSLAVPRAFGDDGVAFGYAYLLLTLVHLAGFVFGGVSALARAIRQVAGPNVLAAGLILGAGYAGGPWHWPLWAAAVAVQWLPPIVTGSASRFPIDAAHFGERHGLMILIVLGESLVSVAVAAESLPVTISLAVGALCGLACSTAMWFCYFAGDDDRAAEAFGQPGPQPSGLVSYDVPHALMLIGVLGVAAGSRLSLPRLTEPATLAAAALLAGGAALYVAALGLFRVFLRFGPPAPRLITAVLLLALIPAGRYAGAAQELAAIAAVLLGLLLLERRRARRAAGPLAERPGPRPRGPAAR